MKIGVQPQVLTYNRDRRRLFLADRSFLFYRQYGSPTWPWERDDTLDAALLSVPVAEQLDLNAEFPLSQRALEDLAELGTPGTSSGPRAELAAAAGVGEHTGGQDAPRAADTPAGSAD
jgi:hypothetical protein